MAKRDYALTTGWAYSSPLKPEALEHVPAYFEVTYDAAGRLVKEVEFKDGRRDNWAEYDGQRRIVRHGHYDRHGDVDRATEVTREGGRVVRLQYYGPKMAPADGKVYAYDGRGRRVSEHRYDQSGALTDYFLFDPPVIRGTTRYRRFTADDKPCGEGETYVD
jgi:YD repeat-containing protein